MADRSRAAAALRWLRLVCRPDPAFAEGTVFTIYYDTPALDCLREKRDGDYLKTKVRIRWYRAGGRETDDAFLEIKSRIGSRREKRRMTLPFRPAWPPGGSLDTPLLHGAPRHFRAVGAAVPDDYRPVLLVRYRRHRFIEPRTGLRVSLDTDIRVPAVSRARRLSPSPLPLPAAVLELKGRGEHHAPESLRSLGTLGFRKAAFSKYAACHDRALTPAG